MFPQASRRTLPPGRQAVAAGVPASSVHHSALKTSASRRMRYDGWLRATVKKAKFRSAVDPERGETQC